MKLFKQSAIKHEELNKDQPEEPEEPQTNKFAQWAADNVDHNICIMTGKGTFHGMGIISMRSQSTTSDKPIVRLKRNEFNGFADTRVPIIQYHGSSKIGLSTLKPCLADGVAKLVRVHRLYRLYRYSEGIYLC